MYVDIVLNDELQRIVLCVVIGKTQDRSSISKRAPLQFLLHQTPFATTTTTTSDIEIFHTDFFKETMNNVASKRVPTWLTESQTLPHLEIVLQTLSKREISRQLVRNSSRTKAPDSPPSRLSRTRKFTARLPSLTRTPSKVEHYSVSVGFRPENIPGNRYLDLEPYDRTRVVVGSSKGEEGDEELVQRDRYYLNASWVRELYGRKWWIAAQAPLPNTAHSFLSVILQPVSRPPLSLQASEHAPLKTKTCRIRTVVQLTRHIEGGRRKAHVYFPEHIGQSWVIPPPSGAPSSTPALKVTLLKSDDIEGAQCVQSVVSIVPIRPPNLDSKSEDDEEPIIFRHLLYVAWPDHGVPEPEHRRSLLEFIRLVDKVNKDLSWTSRPNDLDPDPPVIVGCSAGIGRTGSFIALSSLLRSYHLLTPDSTSPATYTPPSKSDLPPSPLGPLPETLKDDLVAQEIDSLREFRPGMVQREEQVILIYEVLLAAFLESK